MAKIDAPDNHVEVLWINKNHLSKLLGIFHRISARTPKWGNIDFMKLAIESLKNKDKTFRYSVGQNKVSRLVDLLVQRWDIAPRKYPKNRKKPTIDERVFLTTKRVVYILDRNKATFISIIQQDPNLENAYKAFATDYNSTHLNVYFPIDWDTVDQQVRDKVRDLLKFSTPNTKANSLSEVLYASKEDIISHEYFRNYLVQWLIEHKRNGFYFNPAMNLLLQKWNKDYGSHGLRLPTNLTRAKWRNSLQDILWIPNVKIQTLLNALRIDVDVWYKMKFNPEMQWPFPLLPNVSIFNARPLEPIDE